MISRLLSLFSFSLSPSLPPFRRTHLPHQSANIVQFFNNSMATTTITSNTTNTTTTMEAEEDDDGFDTLRDGQEIALYVLAMIAATISIVGSSTIVAKVVRNWKRAAPYDRFLLGLSSCDIVASLTFFLNPFLQPQATSQRAWAVGTEKSCTALGFFTQFSYSAFVYNGMLSFYYLLTVRYGVKRQTLARRYEPWMHFSVIGYFLLTASMGAAIGLYNELDLGPGCWIRDYPRGCYETGGCTGHYFGWVFTGLPTIGTLLAVIINNLVIYFHVKRIFSVKTDHQNYPTTMTSSGTSISAQIQVPVVPQVSATQRPRMTQRHQQHLKEVASQGFLYVGSFFLCYSCQFALRVLESSSFPADEKEYQVYWLLLIDAFLRPLQGFVNMLIYTRPNYVRLRMAYPELGRPWALRQAATSPDIPKLILSSGSYRISSNNNKNNIIKKLSSKQQDKPGSSFVSDLPVVSEASRESDEESSDFLGGAVVEPEPKMDGAQQEKKKPVPHIDNDDDDSSPEVDPEATDPTYKEAGYSMEDVDEEPSSSSFIDVVTHSAVSSSQRVSMDGSIQRTSTTITASCNIMSKEEKDDGDDDDDDDDDDILL